MEAMQDDMHVSGQWSQRFKQPLSRMTSSVAAAHRRMDKATCTLGYRQVCRRLMVKTGSAGVGAGKKSVDVCSTCNCFDLLVQRDMNAIVRDSVTTLSTMWPGYFNDMDISAELPPTLQELDQLQKHIARGGGVRQVDRRRVPQASQDELAAEERRLLCELGRVLDFAMAFSKHFAMRNQMRSAFQTDMTSPTPGTLFVAMDWKDSRKT